MTFSVSSKKHKQCGVNELGEFQSGAPTTELPRPTRDGSGYMGSADRSALDSSLAPLINCAYIS